MNPVLQTAEGRVKRMAVILDDLKAQNVIAIDLRGITDFTDFFLIATMASTPQMRAVAREISTMLKGEGLRPFVDVEDESPRWTILDYGDVVIHLFDAETRLHYDLEALWGDAEEFAWEEKTSTASVPDG